MIRVYTDWTLARVTLVRNALEPNGIPCVIRNQFLHLVDMPTPTDWPEVWIVDVDAVFARCWNCDAERR